MQAMSAITARDKFYNTIVRNGKIVFDNPTQAQLNLPNRPGYTRSRFGMQIKSPLGEELYTNPMNGKFTSSEYEAIKFAEKMVFDGFMKEEHLSIWYSYTKRTCTGCKNSFRSIYTHA